MRILALFFGHDANCTLLEDGEPVVVLEKERLSRIKHDQGVMDIDAILETYGWDPESIDVIVINPYIRPTFDGTRFQWTLQGLSYQDDPAYLQDGWAGPVERRFSVHRIRMFDRWYNGYAVDHHLAHVAGALFTSPFEEAALLTADGSGDFRNCALAYGSGNKIHEIRYGWGYEGAGAPCRARHRRTEPDGMTTAGTISTGCDRRALTQRQVPRLPACPCQYPPGVYTSAVKCYNADLVGLSRLDRPLVISGGPRGLRTRRARGG